MGHRSETARPQSRHQRGPHRRHPVRASSERASCRRRLTVVDFGGGENSAAIWLTGPANPDAVNKDSRLQGAPAFCTRATGSKFPWEEMAMAKITGLCVGESLVGEGNEVAHIDLIMGPRG